MNDVEFYDLPYDRGPEPAKLIAKMPALRAVQALSAGFDNLVPLIRPGVRLANGRGLHDLSVAEHALALVLAAQRELPRWFERQRAGRWDHAHTRSLADARVLLIGHESIGRRSSGTCGPARPRWCPSPGPPGRACTASATYLSCCRRRRS